MKTTLSRYLPALFRRRVLRDFLIAFAAGMAVLWFDRNI